MTVHFEFPLKKNLFDLGIKTTAVQYGNQAGVVFSVYVHYVDYFEHKPY
ncbi:MAG: hypothetical protein JWR01_2891, partial [Subtercola sp.]|nr:hypothetical protein [Subtercola sp.]